MYERRIRAGLCVRVGGKREEAKGFDSARRAVRVSSLTLPRLEREPPQYTARIPTAANATLLPGPQCCHAPSQKLLLRERQPDDQLLNALGERCPV